MPFPKRRYSYQSCAPFIARLRQFLCVHAEKIIDIEYEGECYYYNSMNPKDRAEFEALYPIPASAGFIRIVPHETGIFIYFVKEADGYRPTVSKTHFRLPKLSHLITLVPSDFFTFFSILDTSNSLTNDTISLNLPAANINSIPPILQPFFILLRTNYRINPDFADKKWTQREHVTTIASHPSIDELSQLHCMQLLTLTQNADLTYFPTETALALEIEEFEEQDEDPRYCYPPRIITHLCH